MTLVMQVLSRYFCREPKWLGIDVVICCYRLES